jgi:hypothetical protein
MLSYLEKYCKRREAEVRKSNFEWRLWAIEETRAGAEDRTRFGSNQSSLRSRSKAKARHIYTGPSVPSPLSTRRHGQKQQNQAKQEQSHEQRIQIVHGLKMKEGILAPRILSCQHKASIPRSGLAERADLYLFSHSRTRMGQVFGESGVRYLASRSTDFTGTSQ